MKKTAISLLKSLTEAHGTSGSEDAVRAIFCREVKGCGELGFDRMGSAICTRQGPGGPPHRIPHDPAPRRGVRMPKLTCIYCGGRAELRGR